MWLVRDLVRKASGVTRWRENFSTIEMKPGVCQQDGCKILMSTRLDAQPHHLFG